MAKPIILNYNGEVSSFDHSKLSRSKLYGRRVRVPLDPTGSKCEKADLTDDGGMLLRKGMSGQGYFDATGRFVESRELVGLSSEGTPMETVPSTLGAEVALTGPVTADDLLDLKVASVYMLDATALSSGLAEQLKAGSIFKFGFNYRADYEIETGILLQNGEGIFALIGKQVECDWAALDAPPAPVVTEDEDDDDDFDFEMF